ncbi:MAG: YbaY family lipoprotein, partial [Bacillota bacterium]
LLLAILFTSFANLQAESIELPVTLSYREKIYLGSDAQSAVILVDPTAKEEQFMIKEKYQPLKNGVPISYNLKIDKNLISKDKEYRLHSVIKAGPSMIWSDTQTVKGSEILAKKEIEVITKRLPSRMITFYSDTQNVQIRHLEELAQVIISEKEYLLPRIRTASGVRYLNDEFSVWNKGRELNVDYKGEEFTAKLITLEKLAQNDVGLKARGQEPPWQLELGENLIKLNFGYLQNELSISRNQVKQIENENELIYKIESSFINYEIKVIEEIHRDVMSGEAYPLKVIIKINGREYIGGAYLN